MPTSHFTCHTLYLRVIFRVNFQKISDMIIGPFGTMRIISALIAPSFCGTLLFKRLMKPKESEEWQILQKILFTNSLLLVIMLILGKYRAIDTILRIQFNAGYVIYFIISVLINFIISAANIEKLCLPIKLVTFKDKRMYKMQLWKKIYISFFLILVTIATWTMKYLNSTFGVLQPDQTIFEMYNQKDIKVNQFFKEYLATHFTESIILSIVVLVWIYYFLPISIRIQKFKITIDLRSFLLFYTFLFFFVLTKTFDVGKFLKSFRYSHFMKSYYVDPTKTKLTFPENPRNLIIVLLESVESTFFTKESGGGALENSLIPELEKIARDKSNTQFSHTSGTGGILQTVGSTWSTGGLFTMNCGMPLKQHYFRHTTTEDGGFVPGATCLGDILKEHNYSRTFIVGEKRDHQKFEQLFTTHGVFEFLDEEVIKKTGLYRNDKTRGYWGFEDKVTVDFMKREILKKVREKKPFYIFTKTIDTHVDGVDETTCDRKKGEKLISSILRCNSRILSDFVNWFNQNKLGDNTTLLFIGDHLTMGKALLDELGNTTRTVYNLFLNVKTDDKISKNRKVSTFDFMPTILAAMGIEIDGNRLALGTNLFSGEKTLAEKYGNEELSKYLTMQSEWYDEEMLGISKTGIKVKIDAKWNTTYADMSDKL